MHLFLLKTFDAFDLEDRGLEFVRFKNTTIVVQATHLFADLHMHVVLLTIYEMFFELLIGYFSVISDTEYLQCIGTLYAKSDTRLKHSSFYYLKGNPGLLASTIPNTKKQDKSPQTIVSYFACRKQIQLLLF